MKKLFPRSVRMACLVGSVMAAAAHIDSAQAQGSDALLEILVRKGILTEQEAEDLRADLTRENTAYFNVRAPGKNTLNMSIYGDFRGRYEAFSSSNDDFIERHRARFRLRIGTDISFYENFKAGIRLASGDSDPLRSDPISRNVTFLNNADGKPIIIDLAYAQWHTTPVPNPTYVGAITFGKMKNPFVLPPLVFDGDYTPEGGSTEWVFNLNEEHSIAANAGGFILNESRTDGNEPNMWGLQVRHNGIWKYNDAFKPKVASTVGLTGLHINNAEAIGVVTSGNTGNTTDSGGLRNFNPVVADAGFTYTLDKVPLYNGFFPITLAGAFMHNPAVSDDNEGYSVGVTFGKAGNKATWSLGYEWRRLEADAWWDDVTDSDFGGLNPATALYNSGTNVKGHIVQAAYSPWNALTFAVTWFYADLIREPDAGGSDKMHRVQVDALFKF